MADDLSDEVMKLSISEKKPQPRKDYKLNIRKILSGHDAAGGLTLDAIYTKLSKKFGALTETNKTHIQNALLALEESKEIFEIRQDTKHTKFRLVNHPEFKGYPQDWKLNLTPKRTFKPRKLHQPVEETADGEKLFAFHITCICGHHHVQYIAEPVANLGKKIAFRCECGWRTTLEKS